MRNTLIGLLIAFLIIFACTGAVKAADEELVLKVREIGKMYDCPASTKPNVYFVVGNVGYSFLNDEISYAFAKFLDEKGCHKNGEKYVIFYVSNVNFPSNGTPSGNGKYAEEKWLEYWDYNVRRFSQLGYKIIIHPFPFIINENIPEVDYPPGLRPLTRKDLNLEESEIPVVYECRDGNKTKIASIYDPRTFDMGIRFYQGIRDFFSGYPSFVKISIVPPSDFGEYGFPFGINARWWNGSDSVESCYLTGDMYAREFIEEDPPSYDEYNGRLNEFMHNLTEEVKKLFPSKRYMIYLGYGDDSNPTYGFSYEEAVNFAVKNGIELHSSHGIGRDASEMPLSKIAKNKPQGYEFTLENAGILNEFMQLKGLYHAAKYGATGLVLYPDYFFDYFYLSHLLYAMGSSGNEDMYPEKEIIFNNTCTEFAEACELGSLRSAHLVQGYMDIPKNGDTIDGDKENVIGGWAFYEPPYGDRQYYGIYVYAGHLIENSVYGPDVEFSGGKHPEYMRLVGSAVTSSERCAGCGDTSRFGLTWKPNLAKGKAVLRIFVVNGDSEIVAEHPHSPLIVEINSRIEGNATLERLDFDHGENKICTRKFRMSGIARDSQGSGNVLNIIVIDEHRGEILAEGQTDTNGNFNLEIEIKGNDTLFIMPRAYVYLDGELIALQTNLATNVGGYPKLSGTFLNTVANCSMCIPAEESCDGLDNDCDGYVDNSPESREDYTLKKSCSSLGNKGVCGEGEAVCTTNGWLGCPQTETEICYNGVDEDCNGDDSCFEDVNLDGCVDILDFALLGSNFGMTSGFEERADINGDNLVDVYDLVAIGRNLGLGPEC